VSQCLNLAELRLFKIIWDVYIDVDFGLARVK
jgi:hypothetical protein